MGFEDVAFEVQTSRITPGKPNRWMILGSEGMFTKSGLDPQESALRDGDLDAASENEGEEGWIGTKDGKMRRVPTIRGSWDSYYANIVDHLEVSAPLAVTAEEGREVVRLLEAAVRSSETNTGIAGPWGSTY